MFTQLKKIVGAITAAVSGVLIATSAVPAAASLRRRVMRPVPVAYGS